jgi:hypothetical protein
MYWHAASHNEAAVMASETGQVTVTKDKNYNLVWFGEQSLSAALRLETYTQDAEREGDSELAEFFKRAQGASRRAATPQQATHNLTRAGTWRHAMAPWRVAAEAMTAARCCLGSWVTSLVLL